MPVGLTIRSATAEDEAAVVRLWQVCDLVMSYRNPAADFCLARAKSNSDILVGVNEKDAILGSVMVGHDGHLGWIYYVAADPDCRKQGIGRLIVEAAEAWLRERGIKSLLLLIRETNTQVAEFYNRLGFQTLPRTVMQKYLVE